MDKYPDFIETTGYKEPGGLCGFNCRHGFHPIDPGIDKPTYTQEELDKMKDAKVTLPNGQQVHTYEAMQRQRAMERGIRKTKQALEMASICQNDKLKQDLEMQIKRQQQTVNLFCKTTGLPRIYSRETVKG